MGNAFSDEATGPQPPPRRRAHKHLYLVFGRPEIRFTGSGRAPLIYHVTVPTVETDSVEAVSGVHCSAAVSTRPGVAPLLLPVGCAAAASAETGPSTSGNRTATSGETTGTRPPSSPSTPSPTFDTAVAAVAASVSAAAAAAVETLTGGPPPPTRSVPSSRRRKPTSGAGGAAATHRSGSTPTDDDDDDDDDVAPRPNTARPAGGSPSIPFPPLATPAAPPTTCSGGTGLRKMRFVVDVDDVEAQSGAVRVDVFVRARIKYSAGSGVAIESMDSNSGANDLSEVMPYHVLSTTLREGRCSVGVETEAFSPAALLLPAVSSGGSASSRSATPTVTNQSMTGGPNKTPPPEIVDRAPTRAPPASSAARRGSHQPQPQPVQTPKRPPAPSGFVLNEEGPARGLPSQAHIVVRVMYNSVPSEPSVPGNNDAMNKDSRSAPSGEPGIPDAEAMTTTTAEAEAEAEAAAAATSEMNDAADGTANVKGGSSVVAGTPVLHQLIYFFELPPSATTAFDSTPLTLRAHGVRLLQVGTNELYRLESIFDLGGDAGVHAPAPPTMSPSVASPQNDGTPAHGNNSDDGDHSDHDGGEQGKPLSGSPSAALETAATAAAAAGDDDSDDCVVCLSAPKDTLILPCRHLCLCAACAPLLRQQSNRCPVCRGAIERIVCIR